MDARPSEGSVSPLRGPRAVEHVGAGRSDDLRDIERWRVGVDPIRPVGLHDPAFFEDDHAVCDAHRLVAIMRDIDEGVAEFGLQALRTRRASSRGAGVQGGHRLVHDVGRGVADQRAADRDALAFAA